MLKEPWKPAVTISLGPKNGSTRKMTELTGADVNQHCLNGIMKLSQTHEVTAAEDIFDSRGTKLWAKDAAITPELQARLLQRKLRKPLESTLHVADGVGTQQILDEAQKLCGSIPALAGLMGSQQGAILETLSLTRLEPALSLLLTTAAAQHSGSLSHAVLVSLIALSVGHHAGRPPGEHGNLALAGLLHDVGELYINPAYLSSDHPLTPEEWKHVAVHPRAGEVVLSQLGCVPLPVILAVAEHHERLDGNGYPRQLSGARISFSGQVVGLADILAGIITRRDNALARASLALRLVPGEHAYDLISVIATLRQRARDKEPANQGVSALQAAIQHTAEVGALIDSALASTAGLLAGSGLSPNAQELAMRFQFRLRMLLQALRATGVQEYANYIQENESGDLALELEMVSHEIAWRLRDMARELTLRLTDMPMTVRSAFMPLQHQLDQTPLRRA